MLFENDVDIFHMLDASDLQYPISNTPRTVFDVKNLMGLTLPVEECLNMVISRALTHISLSSASRAEKNKSKFLYRYIK